MARILEKVEPIATSDTPVTDVLLCWDHETGWAHLAAQDRDGRNPPRFLGFIQLPTTRRDLLQKAVTAAGFEVLEQHDLGNDGSEFLIRVTNERSIAASKSRSLK